jgi:hypothetical protein
MNQLDEDYKGLLGSCLYNGIEKTDRTGTGTLSVFQTPNGGWVSFTNHKENAIQNNRNRIVVVSSW